MTSTTAGNDDPHARRFAPGTLRARIADVSRSALATGHLIPYATVATSCLDHGFEFAIRMLDPSVQKPRPQRSEPQVATPQRNPFLPYEPELFVASITSTYLALLNKFKVVDEHLLLVTRRFAEQTGRLTSDDFLALAYCLQEFPGLGFYNGGPEAGASQPHRHLQWIPLPLKPGGPDVPLASALAPRTHDASHQWQRRSELPFAHRWTALDCHRLQDPIAWSQSIALLWDEAQQNRGWQSGTPVPPYNLLITREWMLFVPRRQEFFSDISLNAMAYVGAFFVRDERQRAELVASGPLAALVATADETETRDG